MVEAIGSLMEVAHLNFVDRVAVAFALARYANGADFADMLHLALSSGAASFATFDREIARYAADAAVPVETL